MFIGDILKYNKSFAHINSIISGAEDRIESQTGCKVKLNPKLITIEGSEAEMVDILIDQVLAIWDVDRSYVINQHRKMDKVCMRKLIAMILKNNFPQMAYQEIALKIGKTDHTSALSAITTGYDLLNINDAFFMQYYLPVKRFFQ